MIKIQKCCKDFDIEMDEQKITTIKRALAPNVYHINIFKKGNK